MTIGLGLERAGLWAVRYPLAATLVLLGTVIAALLGFGGVAGLSAELAKIFLLVAVVLVVLGFFFGRGGRVR